MRNKNGGHMGHFTVPMCDHFVNPDINTGRIDDWTLMSTTIIFHILLQHL